MRIRFVMIISVGVVWLLAGEGAVVSAADCVEGSGTSRCVLAPRVSVPQMQDAEPFTLTFMRRSLARNLRNMVRISRLSPALRGLLAEWPEFAAALENSSHVDLRTPVRQTRAAVTTLRQQLPTLTKVMEPCRSILADIERELSVVEMFFPPVQVPAPAKVFMPERNDAGSLTKRARHVWEAIRADAFLQRKVAAGQLTVSDVWQAFNAREGRGQGQRVSIRNGLSDLVKKGLLVVKGRAPNLKRYGLPLPAGARSDPVLMSAHRIMGQSV